MTVLDERERVELLRQIADTAPPGGAGASEVLLRAIVANMPAHLLVIDLRGHMLWTNLADDRHVLGRSIFDFSPAADYADVRAVLERVVRTKSADRYIGFGPGRRGPHSRYENWIAPIVAGDRVIALALISRDVSDAWELYEALSDREQRLSLALRAAGMGTWRFDLRTLTVELDEHARAIYGLSVSTMDSRTFTEAHIHPEDRREVDRRALATATTRRPYVSHNRIIRTDGEVRWVEVTGSPILDERGDLASLLGTITDITERRELEARARQAQRLDAVGSLTAGIAHNFNNLLAAIMPALSLIERDVSASSLPLVRSASLATERAADLVRHLMTFAGGRRGQVSTIEAPSALVERTLALCHSTFDRAIELRVEVEPELPHVRVAAGEIEQALLNLLLNARDAVIARGQPSPRIVVRVAAAPAPNDPDKRAIAITVEDNGPGVPDELRERIFDPFFTTKPVGSGAGLGLATAYAIAREHGGGLTYSGEPGHGARFTLAIPAVDAAPASEEPVPLRVVPSQGRVLVVDDDVFVRDTVVQLLGDAGFTVLAADCADGALTVLSAERAIDVVLLDVNMPGASWRGVVQAVRREHPRTRVVAFTGGITVRDNTVDAWLAKPATPEAIIDTINRAIVGARGE